MTVPAMTALGCVRSTPTMSSASKRSTSYRHRLIAAASGLAAITWLTLAS
jgi:hypothetical protein